MKNKGILVRMLLACVVGRVAMNNAWAYTDFNTGTPLTVNYSLSDFVRLDYLTANNPGTYLTLMPGGSISGIFELYNNSGATIAGGSTNHYIVLYDNSQLSVSSGSLRWSITAFDESHVTFSGGTIGGGAPGGVWSYDNSDFIISGGRILAGGYATDNSHMTFSGGQIDLLKAWNNGRLTITGGKIDRLLEATDSGRITLVGTDFKINGTDVEYGKTAQDYANLLSEYVNSDGISSWSGVITGQLSDGSYMENEFYLIDRWGGDRGDILFVPEPATLLLLSVGAVMLRRRRKV